MVIKKNDPSAPAAAGPAPRAGQGLARGRRAVRAEQKDARREDILAAAARLFEHRALTAISMAELASAAGVAKGTVYLYFATKEAVFLALLERDYQRCFDVVEAGLTAVAPGRLSASAFADIAVAALTEQPYLPRLMAVLATLLEQNIDLETAWAFKRALQRRVVGVGALLESRLRYLPEGGGAAVLAFLHALVVGLQHMAEPAPVLVGILEHPDMAIFRVEFAPALRGALQTHLLGLQAAAQADASAR
ncbi:MAG: TetR family transcriptional regulator [Nevskiales bacterium]|nr:TetR family transcriptional regulator [Nevskiales bacterium]